MKPPYTLTPAVISLVAAISEKIGNVTAHRLHKPPTHLRKENRIRTIQSSLEIEGNTLTIEQVTSILEHKRVLGTAKEILEVQNAIAVYGRMASFAPHNINHLCQAHATMMQGLVPRPGEFRSGEVGIVKGSQVAHLAPPPHMVPSLMQSLFDYLKDEHEAPLIKSCVFHYEFEFIHPFTDGNGRMGRLWQTVILKDKYPIFEFLPVEALIKERQADYYNVLSQCDQQGESTKFIEFMLKIIDDTLLELLENQQIIKTFSDRINYFQSVIGQNWFSRKEYLACFPEISSATASRDLANACNQHRIEKMGDKNKTLYKFLA